MRGKARQLGFVPRFKRIHPPTPLKITNRLHLHICSVQKLKLHLQFGGVMCAELYAKLTHCLRCIRRSIKSFVTHWSCEVLALNPHSKSPGWLNVFVALVHSNISILWLNILTQRDTFGFPETRMTLIPFTNTFWFLRLLQKKTVYLLFHFYFPLHATPVSAITCAQLYSCYFFASKWDPLKIFQHLVHPLLFNHLLKKVDVVAFELI